MVGGIGVVIFLTLLNVKIEGIENVTPQSISILFATEVIGGIILGSGLGYLGGKVLIYIENEFVELEVIITLSLVLLVSVVANKFKDVRAAICHDTYSAAQGVEHDDMNVICLGGRIVGEALAKEIVSEFLESRFISEDRFIRRKEKLDQIEKENPNIDLGLHLTVTSEWRDYKWDGVAISSEIPSMIDENGNTCNGDILILLIAKYLSSTNQLNNDVVVSTVMSNFGFKNSMEKNNFKNVETAVGDKYVAEAMSENNASIGGEQSLSLIHI